MVHDAAPYLVGYTEYRADQPGGMHPYLTSHRACLVRADGTGRRLLAEELLREPYTWTQFAGWSPDGRTAVVYGGWESPENAAWEEEHRTFRMTQGWRHDVCLLDLASGRLVNLTAVERVSDYNAGLFWWPNDPTRLGFDALIDGLESPFSMSLDGTDKRDLTSGAREFTYGFNASPDGTRIAYHKWYKLHVADADGSNARRIETGHPFHFCPKWSPDGEWLLLLAGEHLDCHPYLVRPDGTGLRKLADRQGYRGGVELLDIPSFHSGSSDIPVWAPDGQAVYYTAKFGDSVELMRVSLDGKVQRLTRSKPGVLHYHPTPSPDGQWLLFGSNRSGTRQLYVARVARPSGPPPRSLWEGVALPNGKAEPPSGLGAGGSDPYPLTHVEVGCGAVHGYWQPVALPELICSEPVNA